MTRHFTHTIEWLRRHFLWVFPLATAVVVALVGSWGQTRVREALQRQVRNDLQTTIDANVTALEIWVSDQKRLASTLAADPELLPLARQVLAASAQSPSGTEAFRERMQASAQFAEALNRRLTGTGYKLGQLVDSNLTVLAESGRRRPRGNPSVPESLQPKFLELFKSGQAVMITPFKPPRPTGRFGRGRFGGPLGGPGGPMGSLTSRPPFEPFGRPTTGPGGVPMQAGTGPEPRFRPEGEPPGFGGPGGPPGGRGAGPRDFGPGGPGFQRNTNRAGMTPPREISALMQVAAPIRETNGAVLGALGLILDPEEEFTRILSVARPGDSGETYAFDRHGVLISRSRFESDLKRLALMDPEGRGGSALTLELREPGPEFRPGVRPGGSMTNWPLTRLVSSAIEGSPGITLESSRDYRGIPVVGTWRWLPHLGFGVVTQLDESEAFQPARQLQQVFYALLLLLTLAAVALMWISNAGIRWRQRLGEAELRARRLGQYTLLEKIGEGGMGVVYKARHALMRRDTAVKLLLPEHADDATVARFEKEVRLTCKLKHPCTIQVFDYGRTFDGIFYYAMEFLEGLTLQRLVDSYGPLPPSRVIHVLIQVCDSLAEAHALGLVHRDIKPANIFLCCHGGMTDLVKVLDFGLVGSAVAASDDEEGDAGRHAGTPQYMAPEAFRHDSQPDLRMDLYAVGATAYFLLTGNELFQADSVEAFRAHHESSEAAFPARAIRGPTLEALEELVLQCLEKSPENRPGSARLLAQALRRLQATDAWTQEDSQAWWEAHPEILGNRPPNPGAESASPSQPQSYSSASSPTPTLLIPVTANRSPRPGID